MSDTDNRVLHKLEGQVSSNNERLASLSDRVSDLVDQLATLQNDLNRFKQNVAGDVKYLTERIDSD